jgi:hypothetical protein
LRKIEEIDDTIYYAEVHLYIENFLQSINNIDNNIDNNIKSNYILETYYFKERKKDLEVQKPETRQDARELIEKKISKIDIVLNLLKVIKEIEFQKIKKIQIDINVLEKKSAYLLEVLKTTIKKNLSIYYELKKLLEEENSKLAKTNKQSIEAKIKQIEAY